MARNIVYGNQLKINGHGTVHTLWILIYNNTSQYEFDLFHDIYDKTSGHKKSKLYFDVSQASR